MGRRSRRGYRAAAEVDDVDEERRGTAMGLAAYLIWGAFPLYWPLLEPAGAVEILAHRVIWSLVTVAILLLLRSGWSAWRALPRDRRSLGLLSVAGVLIGINWGVYIWGVNHGHVVETSLGYFVNPLVTVALSVVVLRERLRAAQWAAVGVAAIGVIVLTVQAGRPPWIALVLAFSFGAYGLVKKVVGVSPMSGLLVEAAVLAPVAAAYLIVAAARGNGTFTTHGANHALLLGSAGIVTVIPLLLFAGAAPRIALSRLGLMQYLTPTIQFIIGVTVRHEPLPAVRLVGFCLVWLALGVFTADLVSLPVRDRQVLGERLVSASE
ncbi:MAG TPA: EamA family transporter RarD [Mycobacteriales bacterium]|nr:EamA family transporter RarD [Mycobacteriales bacterium]